MFDRRLKDILIKDFLSLKTLIWSVMMGIGVIPMGFVGIFGQRTAKDFWENFMRAYIPLVLPPVFISLISHIRRSIKRYEINPKYFPVLFLVAFFTVHCDLFFMLGCMIFGNLIRLKLSKFWPFLAGLPDNRMASFLAWPTLFALWVLFAYLISRILKSKTSSL